MVRVRFYTLVAPLGAVRAAAGAGVLGGRIEGDLVSWVCMSLADVGDLAAELKRAGLDLCRPGHVGRVAVLDMHRGLLTPCRWLAVVQLEGDWHASLSDVDLPAELGLNRGE